MGGYPVGGDSFALSDGVVTGFSGQFQTVSFTDVFRLALRCQFGTGLFGMSLQQLLYLLLTIHVVTRLVNA